jgi:hypothetical protein
MFKQLALVLSLALPAVARADVGVEIINNGPTTVYVATAYKNPLKLRHVADGWQLVRPGEKWSVGGRHGEGLYLRVERLHEGRTQELSWPQLALGLDDYHDWLVSSQRFRVEGSGKTTTRVFRWGPRLENRQVLPLDEMPTAKHWTYRSFFRIPGGTSETTKVWRLEVR